MIYFLTFSNVTYTLYVVAFALCLLVLTWLVVNVPKKDAIIPIVYFISLSAGFFNIGGASWLMNEASELLRFLLLTIEYSLPVLGLLFIIQFVRYTPPPLLYWLALVVHGVVLFPFIYLVILGGEVFCPSSLLCLSARQGFYLAYIIISCFSLGASVLFIARKANWHIVHYPLRHHTYWLVIMLVILHIGLLITNLLWVLEKLSWLWYLFTQVMLKITFIYFIFSSMVKMLVPLMDSLRLHHKVPLSAYEMVIAHKAQKMLADDKLYRQFGFNRAVFARYLKIKEHRLSRIVNMKFGKSVSEFANTYRIKEAKELLTQTQQPVTEISFAVGFNSIASFNRVFKDHTGVSPSRFRNVKWVS